MSTSADPEAVYAQLVSFFQAHASRTAEVEVLPSSYPLPDSAVSGILRDGRCLAVRKKDLASAFAVAREHLFQTSATTRDLTCRRSCGPAEAAAATAVVLFFDPEHLTAANERKRQLLRQGELLAGAPGTLTELVLRELAFVSTLLTSPLRRHTKSPTLWYHRLWVVERYGRVLHEGRAAELWRAEHAVVLKAADRHFANYYAFDYARRLASLLGGRPCACAEVLRAIQAWCFSHPRDISGWTYWAFLLRQESNGAEERKAAAVRAAETFSRNLSWEGKSLDSFLLALR